MELLSVVVIIIASFIWGYLTGKISGLKEGYRNCMREVLKARCEGRTYIGSTLDDWLDKEELVIDRQKIRERLEGLDTIYGKEYESEEL